VGFNATHFIYFSKEIGMVLTVSLIEIEITSWKLFETTY